MPVSSTATTTPSPLNTDLSAPTAFTPQVTSLWPLSAAGEAIDLFTGATSFIGMTGATASTLLCCATFEATPRLSSPISTSGVTAFSADLAPAIGMAALFPADFFSTTYFIGPPLRLVMGVGNISAVRSVPTRKPHSGHLICVKVHFQPAAWTEARWMRNILGTTPETSLFGSLNSSNVLRGRFQPVLMLEPESKSKQGARLTILGASHSRRDPRQGHANLGL